MNLAKCVYGTTGYFTAINLIGEIMYISQLHSKMHFTCFTSETLLLLHHNRNVYGWVGMIAMTTAKRALSEGPVYGELKCLFHIQVINTGSSQDTLSTRLRIC